MTTPQEALRRLEEADPVSSPKTMPSAAWSSAALLDRIDERSGDTNPRPITERLLSTPPIRRGRGPLIAIATAVVVLAIGAAMAILTLSGEGGNDVITPSTTTTVAVQALQPDLITSYDDVAGTYLNREPVTTQVHAFALHIFEDGTWHVADNPFTVDELPEETYETRFEGTKVFLKETLGDCGSDTEAIYEIGLLENGNLRIVPIEDTCGTRSRSMGHGEFEPFLVSP